MEGDGDEVTRGSKTVMDASVQMSIKNHGHMKRESEQVKTGPNQRQMEDKYPW